MSDKLANFPGISSDFWQFGQVICAEFSEWREPQPGTWVELAEEIADRLGISKRRGNGFGGNITANGALGVKATGSWGRIRKKVKNILTSPGLHHSMHIDSGYDYVVGEEPDDGYIAMGVDTDPDFNLSRMWVVVTAALVGSPDEFVKKIEPALTGKLDARYGGVYVFPKAVSGNYYVSNATFIGEEVYLLGGDSNLLNIHGSRMSRARLRSTGLYRYAKGYVREVFDINFLSEAHLVAPLLGATVLDYARKVGDLKACALIPGLFMWCLREELSRARRDWENSGLVLSAEREPILF